MSNKLSRNNIKSFVFNAYQYDFEKNEISLIYSFDDEVFFDEKITFKNAPIVKDKIKKQAIERLLQLLHIAGGVSYYKAFVPKNIEIKTIELDEGLKKFFDDFYKKGLGEFSYKNNIDIKRVIDFPYNKLQKYQDLDGLTLKRRTLVPIGGGKDSSVTLQSLIDNKQDVTPVAVGRPRAIKETIDLTGLDSIEITRKISQNLFEINNTKEALNGHIPVTGVFAFILAIACIVYDYDSVAMSNERSANVGNIVQKDGFSINHQWSKSFEFEKSFNQIIKEYVTENISYFSYLRPLSELDIAKRFSKIEKYHDVFTSCNNAFKIHKEIKSDRWCCDCDKCRFVFLALSPFMKKEKLVEVFGKNLLDEKSQLSGFKELLGLANFKPFECVGQIEESVGALYLLSQNPAWKNDFVIKETIKEVLEKHENPQNYVKEAFEISNEHGLNDKYLGFIKNDNG